MNTCYFRARALHLCGLLLALPALGQDVSLTSPTWINPPDRAIEPPTIKKSIKAEYPDELRKQDVVGYAVIYQRVTPEGKIVHFDVRATNGLFANAVRHDHSTFRPATHDGKPVDASVTYAVIFNPKSASSKSNDAKARLLDVRPVVLPKELTDGKRAEVVLWASVSLDANGKITKTTFESEPAADVLQEIEKALQHWKFAPARQNGSPVASELRVPILLHEAIDLRSPVLSGTPPKVVRPVPPVYPMSMRYSGIKGQVVLQFVVTPEGNVSNVTLLESNNPAFNEPAVDAIRKWKFEPGRNPEGKPVATMMRLPMMFSMNDTPDGGIDFAKVSRPEKRDGPPPPEALQYDVSPKPRSIALPVYPYELLRDGKEGSASIQYLIDHEGQVRAIKVIEASAPEFAQALAAAANSYLFEPALKKGAPCPSLIASTEKFKLRGSDSFVHPDEHDALRVEKKQPDRIVAASKLDTPLKPIVQRPGVFPCTVEPEVQEGHAVVEFLVDETGRVRLPRIHKASSPAFGYSAVQAVYEWRFEPPKVRGKATWSRARVPVVFRRNPPPNES
jgi:TonB family protein